MDRTFVRWTAVAVLAWTVLVGAAFGSAASMVRDLSWLVGTGLILSCARLLWRRRTGHGIDRRLLGVTVVLGALLVAGTLLTNLGGHGIRPIRPSPATPGPTMRPRS